MPTADLTTLYLFGRDHLLDDVTSGDLPFSSVNWNTFPDAPDHQGVIVVSVDAPQRWEALGMALEHHLPLVCVGEKRITPFAREVFLSTALPPQPTRVLFREDRLRRLARMSQDFLRRSRTGGNVDRTGILDTVLLLLHEDDPFMLRVWTEEGEGEIAGREGLVVRSLAPGHRGPDALLWMLTREEGLWVLARNVHFRATEEGFSLMDALLSYAREALENETELLSRFS